MIKVNIFEVKAKLSEYIKRAVLGERVVICRHNKPVAELKAVEAIRAQPRPIGPLAGRPTFKIPSSFFAPLPAAELDLWEGVAFTDPLSPEWTAGNKRAGSRVAETEAKYRARRGSRPARRRS